MFTDPPKKVERIKKFKKKKKHILNTHNPKSYLPKIATVNLPTGVKMGRR